MTHADPDRETATAAGECVDVTPTELRAAYQPPALARVVTALPAYTGVAGLVRALARRPEPDAPQARRRPS